jgi:tetratricopeptide (TPR) repeat protein
VLVTALTTKGNILVERGRPVEGTALLIHATSLALEQELGTEAVRGLYNMAEDKMAAGRYAEAEELLERGLSLTSRRGDRQGERWLVAQGMFVHLALGRWDELLASGESLRNDSHDDQWSFNALTLIPHVIVQRGELALAERLLEPLSAETDWGAELFAVAQGTRALIMRATGNAQEALPVARASALAVVDRGQSHAPLEFTEAVECAFATGDVDVVRELLARVDALKPVQLTPLLDAEAMRARARLGAHDRDLDPAQRWFRRSIDLFRELATPFHLARAQIEYAELLGDVDQARAPREEAAAVFEKLHATPWLKRARSFVDEVVA